MSSEANRYCVFMRGNHSFFEITLRNWNVNKHIWSLKSNMDARQISLVLVCLVIGYHAFHSKTCKNQWDLELLTCWYIWICLCSTEDKKWNENKLIVREFPFLSQSWPKFRSIANLFASMLAFQLLCPLNKTTKYKHQIYNRSQQISSSVRVCMTRID